MDRLINALAVFVTVLCCVVVLGIGGAFMSGNERWLMQKGLELHDRFCNEYELGRWCDVHGGYQPHKTQLFAFMCERGHLELQVCPACMEKYVKATEPRYGNEWNMKRGMEVCQMAYEDYKAWMFIPPFPTEGR